MIRKKCPKCNTCNYSTIKKINCYKCGKKLTDLKIESNGWKIFSQK